MPKDGKRRRVEGTEAKVKAAGGGGGKGIPSHWASSSARTTPTATAAAAAAAKATATSELPIAAARARLVEQVAAHPTVVLVGDTGSGKTTQLPQYLYRAGFCRKGAQIGCTQPRRVAAVSVAQRVASEMGVAVGGLVG
jgi:HrpA-like RNA helicase